MSRREEISPFLGRDYKHVADYAPAGTTPDEKERADRLKGKMLIERLLYKRWSRDGTLEQRVIQRLGDWGRSEGLTKVILYVGSVKLLIILLWLLTR